MAKAVGNGAKMGIANPNKPSQQGNGGSFARAVSPRLVTTWTPSNGIPGLDVSAYQGIRQTNGSYIDSVNWQDQWNQGARFAFIKATEGDYYQSQTYGQQTANSAAVGMFNGAYHFAIPNWSSGATQASYFVNNGGNWNSGGKRLPPVLDIEYNPYAGQTINGIYMGDTCYSMSPSQMVNWVLSFGQTVQSLTGRLPIVYTTTDWWTRCTGNATGLGDFPLWIAAYPYSPSNTPGALPASWGQYNFWQYSSSGPFAGDSNIWQWSMADLANFAATNSQPSLQSDFFALASKWNLGSPTSVITCGLIGDGCLQDYSVATIYKSPTTQARVVADPIRQSWWNTGGQGGRWGYPVSEQVCGLIRGGCTQDFQGGSYYITPANQVASLTMDTRNRYWALGGQNSSLGYPVGSQICGLTAGGCVQQFESGNMYWPAGGIPRAVQDPVKTLWAQTGNETGPWGYPTSDYGCTQIGWGCLQDFQNASVYGSSAGTFVVTTAVRSAYWNSGGPAGPLGYPTASEICSSSACTQQFQSGIIVRTPSGQAYTVAGAFWKAYNARGGSTGPLGLPTVNAFGPLYAGGLEQDFTLGSLYSWNGTVAAVAGSLRQFYWASGGQAGVLGYPTSDLRGGLVRGGSQQDFANGTVYLTPGAQMISVTGAFRTAYWQNAGQGGALGYPTGPLECGLAFGGCQQNFEGGQLASRTGSPVMVAGQVSLYWQRLGGVYSQLGYPVAAETCGLSASACKQSFDTGAVFDHPTLGVHAVSGAIAVRWGQTGAQDGSLGYPKNDATCSSGYCTQNFERGTITSSPDGSTAIG